MSQKHEGVSGGGQNGPSDLGEEGSEAMLAIARHLAGKALSLTGELTVDASIQLALRDEVQRVKLLEDLVAVLAPDEVSLEQWTEWLDGGESPFPKRKQVEKVGTSTEWPSQTLVRTSPRVSRQQKKVEALRAQLKAEEVRLKFAQAHDRAAMQWFVTDHLIALLGPVFAMGPAWTVLRAISAHVPQSVADEATIFEVGKGKEIAVESLRKSRKAETALMLDLMDLGSGVVEFEEAIRAALLTVCQDFEKRRDALIADGRRPRSKEKLSSEVHPKARNDAQAILNGLSKAS